VKRLFALLAGLFGLRVLLRRRPAPASAPDPADDLRARLAETRATAEALDDEAASPEPEPAADDRRADVHARARQAMDELRDS
jgi:hypothetical protein